MVNIMEYYRKTAIVVGLLFISATVTSILSSLFLGSLASAISLVTVNASSNQLVVAAILELIAAISAFATAVFIYPVLKKHIESLAIAYVGFRTLENALYIVSVVALLALVTLSQQFIAGGVNAPYEPLISMITALRDWSLAIGTVLLAGVGSVTLNYVLYKSKLIPIWLSLWGLIGAALLILYGLFGIVTTHTGLNSPLTILAAPIAVQEMVFAVWLIFKGFNPESISAVSQE